MSTSASGEALLDRAQVFLFHQVPIDFVAQARFSGGVHLAVEILNILYQAKFVGAGAGEKFKELTVLMTLVILQ